MELVELLGPQAGEHIIDIGGGIGGPARWIASRFGCLVTSLDLTPEFCRAAEELNGATGLSDRVAAVEGSAVDLPFEQASFDRAYSENVVMNIADKRSFYGEAFRVLRSGGLFAFSNYGTGSAGEPYYPAPWAASAEMSFLSTVEETRSDLLDAGGLMSYGLNFCQHFARVAFHANSILRWSKPADIPVELPTTFELVINNKAAQALGLTVPSLLPAGADEVIE
jgi:SAM-dependent methyltransferase